MTMLDTVRRAIHQDPASKAEAALNELGEEIGRRIESATAGDFRFSERDNSETLEEYGHIGGTIQEQRFSVQIGGLTITRVDAQNSEPRAPFGGSSYAPEFLLDSDVGGPLSTAAQRLLRNAAEISDPGERERIQGGLQSMLWRPIAERANEIYDARSEALGLEAALALRELKQEITAEALSGFKSEKVGEREIITGRHNGLELTFTISPNDSGIGSQVELRAAQPEGAEGRRFFGRTVQYRLQGMPGDLAAEVGENLSERLKVA